MTVSLVIHLLDSPDHFSYTHTVPEEEHCAVQSNVDSVFVCAGHIGQWAGSLALGFSFDTVASKPLASWT